MGTMLRIPTPLRKYSDGKNEVEVNGKTVKEILADLEKKHPGFKEAIFAADGNMKRFVNIYLNENDIRFLDFLETEVKQGDTLAIIPAIAGGNHLYL